MYPSSTGISPHIWGQVSTERSILIEFVAGSLPGQVGGVYARLANELRFGGDSAPDIEQYAKRLLSEAPQHEFLDVSTAREAIYICRALLQREGNSPDPERRLAVITAAQYLILAEDAEDDVNSVIGFDDDLQVAEAVARALGYDDLIRRQR